MANLTGGSEAIPLGLSEEIISHLGVELRKLYADPLEQKVPVYLRRLRKRAFQVLRARHEPVSEAFVAELISLLPEMRSFALSLTRDSNHAGGRRWSAQDAATAGPKRRRCRSVDLTSGGSH